MIVAITGGTGFIGKRLARFHLAQGDEVRILSRRPLPDLSSPARFYQADLTLLSDYANIISFADGAEVLYNCAGEIRDPSLMETLHVAGTQRLIEAANGRIGRWVQLSSTGAYGSKRRGIITEKTDPNPRGPYEKTKLASDQLVIAASQKGAFQHVILRPSIVYGAAMPNRSLYSLISTVNRGLFFFVGRPGASANYIHVDNVVEALRLCGTATQASGEIYNLSDHCTMEQFISAVAKALDSRVPELRLPELPIRLIAGSLGHVRGFPLTLSRIDALTGHAIYSNEKIGRQLGYRHLLTMEDGLTELVNFWKAIKSKPVRKLL